MKKYRRILTGLLLLINASVFAQSNIIKTSFTDDLTGNFNLNYEREIQEKQTLLFKIGFMKPTASPFFSENTLTPEAYTFNDSKGGISTSLEYRFYMTKKGPMQGFYVAPYMRFLNQSMDYFDEINSGNFHVDGGLNSLGLGAVLGYQLIIEEIISLDFYFFGAGIDYHMINLKYELVQPQAGFDYSSIIDDVGEVFQDINYLYKKLEHEVNDDNLTSKLPFLFPGFRIGISLGVAF